MEATECAVSAVREVGPNGVAIDVETPPDFDARPGQFVKLTFDLAGKLPVERLETLAAEGEIDVTDPGALDPDDRIPVSRFYTISSPDVDGDFEITVSIDPDGTVAPVLSDLEAGSVVSVSGPFGNDYYEGEDPVVVLAGGPGVGPAVGIAERAVADEHGAAVIYRDDEPMHEDRLAALRGDGATVSLLHEEETLEAEVAEVLDAYGTDSQIFVYGFADFIDDSTAAIEAAGGDAAGAKIENFG